MIILKQQLKCLAKHSEHLSEVSKSSYNPATGKLEIIETLKLQTRFNVEKNADSQ